MNRRVRLSLLAIPAALFSGCADGPTAVTPSETTGAAPLPYVVVFRDTATDAAAQATRLARQLPSLRATATITTPGISARVVETEAPIEVLSSAHAIVLTVSEADAQRLRGDASVAVVEPVRAMQLAAITQSATRSWALDRIDQQNLPLDGKLTRLGTDGTGVRVAIFDTGIRWTHSDLAGRVAGGYDAFTNAPKTSGDAQGHGTFVASLAAGRTWGTAPAATLLDVRVLNAQGAGSSVELARGVDWVIAEKKRVAGPMVVNMSLGFNGISTAVDALVDRLRGAGITVVVAAGNSQVDACGTSPARAPGAITVASTAKGITDVRSSFSNFGACVDLNAPGEAVIGAGSTSDAGLVQGSGTSMASPYVAGAAATYLSSDKAATPDAVARWLLAESTMGKVSGLVGSTPNRLLTLRRLPTTTSTTPATPTPAPRPTPTPTPTPTPAPAPTPTTGVMTLTTNCVARTCTLDVTVPTNVSAASAASVVYTWKLGTTMTMSGNNLRRQTIMFGSAAALPVTVTAKLGTTVLATATKTLTVP